MMYIHYVKKKNLAITGSSGLIGKSLVKYFKKDFNVIELDIDLGHDLCDTNFVKEWFRNNKNLYGIIICHAINPLPLENAEKITPIDYTIDEIKEYLDVNLVSAYDVVRNFIKNNSSGKIINISSLYGSKSPKHFIYNNFTKHIGYSLSKGGLLMMSKYLAAYYGKNYNINTVILGGVYEEGLDKKFVANYSQNTPSGRMMDLEEAISVFEFLLDKKSSYINGTEITIDGGWNAW